MDSDAIDEAMSNLQAFTQAANIGASIENILQNTLIGKYEKTVSIIDELFQIL